HRVRGQNQVPDVLRVRRPLEMERVLDGADRGDRVHRGADAAEPLREQPRLTRIAPLQDALDAAEHLARRPRLADDAAVDFRVDAEVTFDAGDGINGDTRHLASPV